MVYSKQFEDPSVPLGLDLCAALPEPPFKVYTQF